MLKSVSSVLPFITLYHIVLQHYEYYHVDSISVSLCLSNFVFLFHCCGKKHVLRQLKEFQLANSFRRVSSITDWEDTAVVGNVFSQEQEAG